MHQYGTKPEQLAAVAVAARQWAALNPKAWSRGPLSIDDVLAWYDGLDRKQVQAVIEFAARSLDLATSRR